MQVLRFENEAEDLLHYLKDAGLDPGLEGDASQDGDGDEVVLDAGGGREVRVLRTRRRDRLGRRRPVAAAAHRAARAARARARPLRALVAGGPAGQGRDRDRRRRGRRPRRWRSGSAGEGVTVVIADVDDRAGHAAVGAIGEGSGAASFVRADVRVTGDVEHMVGVAEERHGGVDILVNNAGGWGPTANYPYATALQWSSALYLNLRAPMLATQLVLEPMRRTSARGGERGLDGRARPRALRVTESPRPAKAGLIRFTACMAYAHQDTGVRVDLRRP